MQFLSRLVNHTNVGISDHEKSPFCQNRQMKELIHHLRVCPREDQADVTHAISPISLKLSQMIKVIKLFKSPK